MSLSKPLAARRLVPALFPLAHADAASAAASRRARRRGAFVATPPAPPPSRMVTRARTGALRPSQWYSADEYLLAASSVSSPLPSSARAALRDPHWLAAMQEEFDALQRNRTWQLVPRPPHANVISGKWVFRHKTRPDGTLER